MSKTGCIIVPYRDRSEHLEKFIPHYKDLVPDLPIIVVEQADDKPFNRAKLLNIGFLEVGHKFDYCIFHDVDMLAENAEGYKGYVWPMHLATACSQFDYKMPYPEYFGGVTMIPTKYMHVVNGYSNDFWGWGAEDDEMRNSLDNKGIDIWSISNKRYECLSHERVIVESLRQKNADLLSKGRSASDGLSNCIYDKIGIYQNHMNDNTKHNWTQIVVKL